MTTTTTNTTLARAASRALAETSRRVLAASAFLALVVLGCDGSGDEAASGATAAGEDEYCAVIAEVGDELPSDEQLDRVLAAAPEAIAENLEVVIDAVRERGEAAFTSPEVVANAPMINAYEAQHCATAADGRSTGRDPAAVRLEVEATEYAFALEDPPVGAVELALVNAGDEVHEMYVGRLADGVELEQVLAAPDPVGDGLAEEVGFVGPVAPGGEATLQVDLDVGRYALVCFIPTAEGRPHAELGMVAEVTVG